MSLSLGKSIKDAEEARRKMSANELQNYCPKLRKAHDESQRFKYGQNDQVSESQKTKVKELTKNFEDVCNIAEGPIDEAAVKLTSDVLGPTLLRGTTDLGEFRGFSGGSWFSSGEVFMSTYYQKAMAYAVPRQGRDRGNTSKTVPKSTAYFLEFDTEKLARVGEFRPGALYNELIFAGLTILSSEMENLMTGVGPNESRKRTVDDANKPNTWDYKHIENFLKSCESDTIVELSLTHLVATMEMFMEADGKGHQRLQNLVRAIPGYVDGQKMDVKIFKDQLLQSPSISRLYDCYISLVATSELRWIPFKASDHEAYGSCVESVRLFMFDLMPHSSIYDEMEPCVLPAACPSFLWERSSPDDANIVLEDVAIGMGASVQELGRRKLDFIASMKAIFGNNSRLAKRPRD
jgi:hypothetical protein